MLSGHLLKALHAEWRKLSPDLTGSEGMTERELRLWWTEKQIPRFTRNDKHCASWKELKTGEARYLLRKMREESGDGPAWRAELIARIALELFGADWDRLLRERIGERFRVEGSELKDLTPFQAKQVIEELLSRLARKQWPVASGECSVEEKVEALRRKFRQEMRKHHGD